MAKNFLHDIRPADREESPRRGIERESLPESSRPITMPPRFSERTFYTEPTPRRGRKLIWVIAGVVVIVAGLGVATMFSTASVSITPKSLPLSLEGSVFNAGSVSSSSVLSFKIVKASGTAQKVATASTTTDAAGKAVGTVILYNAFSTAPQKLSIDTRLSTPDGKIYKTDTALTVPGMKTVNGKSVPGSIETGVHSDLAGPTYNIGLTDFTVVGFKGTPKYTKFYGRSKTPMTGGSNGKMYVLSEAEGKIAHEAAVGALADKLKTDVIGTLPEEAVFLPGAYVIRETAGPSTYTGETEKVTVEAKGTLIGILFDKKELTEKLATVGLPEYTANSLVTIPELQTFTLDIKNKELLSENATTISFGISGKGAVVWDVDANAITTSLAGVSKKDISGIMANFPNVSRASVKISPFWAFSIPSDTKKINVTIQKAENTSVDQ